MVCRKSHVSNCLHKNIIRFYLKTKQNFSFCNRVDARPGRKERTAEHYTIFKSQEGVKLCSLECYTLEILFYHIHSKCTSRHHCLVPEHLRSIVTTTDKAHLEPNLPLASAHYILCSRMNGSFFSKCSNNCKQLTFATK